MTMHPQSKSRQTWFAALCIAAASTVAAATPGSANTDRVVKVGVFNQPPYNAVSASGELGGVCPDMFVAAMKTQGITKLEVTSVTSYAALIPGLLANRWDAVVACLQINSARCEQVAFSDPIYAETWSFLVPTGNPKNIARVDQFVADRGLKLGVLNGSNIIGQVEGLGVERSQLVMFPDNRAAVDGMQANRADAFLAGTGSLHAIPTGNLTITVATPEVTPKSTAVALRKGDDELLATLNKGLDELRTNGEFDAINQKYGLDPAVPRSQTTEEQCKI